MALWLCVLQEMGQRKAQQEYEHAMLVRHHESTQDLEFKHLASLAKCKDEQLKRQVTLSHCPIRFMDSQ
jgi:thousand and one amino acid protein kinase